MSEVRPRGLTDNRMNLHKVCGCCLSGLLRANNELWPINSISWNFQPLPFGRLRYLQVISLKREQRGIMCSGEGFCVDGPASIQTEGYMATRSGPILRDSERTCCRRQLIGSFMSSQKMERLFWVLEIEDGSTSHWRNGEGVMFTARCINL